MNATSMLYLRPYLWVETDGNPRRILAHVAQPMRLAVDELSGFLLNLEGVAELAVLDSTGNILCYI